MPTHLQKMARTLTSSPRPLKPATGVEFFDDAGIDWHRAVPLPTEADIDWYDDENLEESPNEMFGDLDEVVLTTSMLEERAKMIDDLDEVARQDWMMAQVEDQVDPVGHSLSNPGLVDPGQVQGAADDPVLWGLDPMSVEDQMAQVDDKVIFGGPYAVQIEDQMDQMDQIEDHVLTLEAQRSALGVEMQLEMKKMNMTGPEDKLQKDVELEPSSLGVAHEVDLLVDFYRGIGAAGLTFRQRETLQKKQEEVALKQAEGDALMVAGGGLFTPPRPQEHEQEEKRVPIVAAAAPMKEDKLDDEERALMKRLTEKAIEDLRDSHSGRSALPVRALEAIRKFKEKEGVVDWNGKPKASGLTTAPTGSSRL